MFALIVSACLVGQPDTCLQDVVLWSAKDETQSCAALADAKMPLWARAHPNYIIQGTWCQPERGPGAAVTAEADPPLDCPLRSRPAIMAWAHQNPGKSYWENCRRQDTN